MGWIELAGLLGIVIPTAIVGSAVAIQVWKTIKRLFRSSHRNEFDRELDEI